MSWYRRCTKSNAYTQFMLLVAVTHPSQSLNSCPSDAEQMFFLQVPTNCGPLSVVTREGIPNIFTYSVNIFLAALAPVRQDMVTGKAMV